MLLVVKMNKDECLKIKDWDKLQHYKKRNPPWVKLYNDVTSTEWWVMCSDASRALAIACMVEASRNNGCVPCNSAYMMRRHYLQDPPDFKQLIDNGFLVDASNSHANASNLHTNATPETETETETEESKSPSLNPSAESIQRSPSPEASPKKRNGKNVFRKPTIEELEAYVAEKRLRMDCQDFMDYYGSNGWRVGRNPMKDWRLAACRWSRNGNKYSGSENNDYYKGMNSI